MTKVRSTISFIPSHTQVGGYSHIVYHQLLVIQKTANLFQKAETTNWDNSDPIRMQNRP